MEADCEDHTESKPPMPSLQPVDLERLFSVFTSQISTQLTSQTSLLRDEIRFNESRIIQENEDFKLEMREEIDNLRRLLHTQQERLSDNSSMQAPMAVSSTPDIAVSSDTVSSGPVSATPPVVSSSSTTSNTSTPTPDLHAQMMLMMAESFSKLSTVLAESKTDSKSDWPKFSGESRKFRDWYLAIMTQISLPPWNVLYDSVSNDVVTATTNSQLNGKLYSKIILSLEGKALKHAVSRKHLQWSLTSSRIDQDL